MKKWRVLTLLLLVVVPIVYIKVNEARYAARVETYLVQERGYVEEDIAHIKGHYGVKLPTFYVTVVFVDELQVTYTYYAHNEVYQAEAARAQERLEQEELSTLLHWE